MNSAPSHLRPTPASAGFWAFVTTFGALWGAFEVTVGAFLHSLRLPMGGVLLAGLSGVLLVAGRQVFPVRGSSLAAGVVAALLKSLSPGGVILGPMLGIFTEAALVELALLPGSQSLLTTAAAGALATAWAGLQGVATALVVYGTPIVELYLRLAQRLSAPLGLPAATAGWLFAGYTGALLAAGAVAGWVGRRAGRQAAQRLRAVRAAPAEADTPDGATVEAQRQAPASDTESCVASEGPSLRNRRLLGAVFLGAMLLQLGRSDLLAAVALALALFALAVWGRDALRALWWPRFWALSVVVTLGAGLLLGPARQATPDASWQLSLAGLQAGGRMLARSALLFAAASWAARAVRPAELVRLWARVGVPQMGSAVTGALLLLPVTAAKLRERLKGTRRTRLWTTLLDALAETVVSAERSSERAPPPDRLAKEEGEQ